jgi:hypothetical protein
MRLSEVLILPLCGRCDVMFTKMNRHVSTFNFWSESYDVIGISRKCPLVAGGNSQDTDIDRSFCQCCWTVMTSSCALIDQCDDEIPGYRGDRLVELRCSGKRDRTTCLLTYLFMVHLTMLLLMGSSALLVSWTPYKVSQILRTHSQKLSKRAESLSKSCHST